MTERKAQRRIRRYLGRPSVHSVLGVLMLGLCFACLYFAVLMQEIKTPAEISDIPLDTHNAEQAGQPVYLDVVGISDLVYKHNSKQYYIAVDDSENFYIVLLDEEVYGLLSAQKAYWNAPETAEEETYRLAGKAAETTDAIFDAFAQGWNLSGADAARARFGTLYLDTTEPAFSNIQIYAVISSVLLLILSIAESKKGSRKQRELAGCIKILKEKGQTIQAAEELQNATVYRHEAARISENFLFCRKTGTVLSLEDIRHVYTAVAVTFGVRKSPRLIADTSDGMRFTLCSAAGLSKNKAIALFTKIVDRIKNKTPDLEIGDLKA